MAFRSKAGFLPLLALALLLGSCWNPFHPPLVDNSDGTLRYGTPLEVLQSLELAYKERNINIYKEILAPDFRFELISSEVGQIGIDVNGDGIRDSWWGYDQEVLYTSNLFSTGSTDGSTPAPDDLYLRLQVPPETNWEEDPELGHEDWVVIPCNFDLKLSYYASNSMLTASGIARFYLKPANNRWYIAIWRDESNL
ncbi:MAG: hypothetical protein PHD87_02885 [Candidatus Cloacimonetes bacterium]|jgi:hypothetical protein|nr:hypothetical protein [Candidatus Cloacimonadota bacterium]MDD4223510.1 hypothetical protein [Candidatus Cloacimonadota bacterium]